MKKRQKRKEWKMKIQIKNEDLESEMKKESMNQVRREKEVMRRWECEIKKERREKAKRKWRGKNDEEDEKKKKKKREMKKMKKRLRGMMWPVVIGSILMNLDLT